MKGTPFGAVIGPDDILQTLVHTHRFDFSGGAHHGAANSEQVVQFPQQLDRGLWAFATIFDFHQAGSDFQWNIDYGPWSDPGDPGWPQLNTGGTLMGAYVFESLGSLHDRMGYPWFPANQVFLSVSGSNRFSLRQRLAWFSVPTDRVDMTTIAWKVAP